MAAPSHAPVVPQVVAAWAAHSQHTARVRGALLVAPPDPPAPLVLPPPVPPLVTDAPEGLTPPEQEARAKSGAARLARRAARRERVTKLLADKHHDEQRLEKKVQIAEREDLATVFAELAAKVPGARVSVYPESGHSPFAEEPERFNRELIEFARATLKK